MPNPSPKPRPIIRTAKILLTITPETREHLQAQADAHGLPLATYCAMILHKQAHKDIAKAEGKE